MIFPRYIQKNINKWLNRDEILLLTGSRQVGKTTLLRLIEEELHKMNFYDDVVSLDLEDIRILDDLNGNPRHLLNYQTGKQTGKKNVILIDEIQYLDNPSRFLKYIYDHYKEKIKLIVTGSSSLEIKPIIQDSLVGRIKIFRINTLNFFEFLNFKQFSRQDFFLKKSIPPSYKEEFDNLLREYLTYGGLPKIVLTNDKEIKKELLKDYISLYINKDIRSIAKIANIFEYNHLLAMLASQIGGLVNINELSNTLNMSHATIKRYMDILKQTFIIDLVPPYYKNIRTQISKMKKVYFKDIGVRNYLLNTFSVDLRNDGGPLMENFIYRELCNFFNEKQVYYFRTHNKQEINFVIEKGFQDLTAIEVKSGYFKKPKRQLGLEYFQKQFNHKIKLKLFTVNMNLNTRLKDVEYIDYLQFLKRFYKG